MLIVFPKDYIYRVEERNDLDISLDSREEVQENRSSTSYNINIEEDIDNEYVDSIIGGYDSFS